MARTDEEKRKAARERARDYVNVRLPRELIERVDALRERQPVAPAREPYVTWLLTQAIEAEEGKR